MRTLKRGALSALTISLLAAVTFSQTNSSRRSVRVDDYYGNDEGISQLTLSPDGKSLAFVRTRPANTLPPRGRNNNFVRNIFNADIWLRDYDRQPRNLTNGQTDVSGWWWPQWSPDGQRLAFLSTRGNNLTLWVWERATDEIRQASRQGIIWDQGGSNPAAGRSFRWLDDRRILCSVPVIGESSPPDRDYGQAAARTIEAWEQARRGEVTASVVDSTEFRYPQRSLYLLDVASGEGRRIATTLKRHNFFPDFWPSPDGTRLALISPVPSSYNMASNARMGFPHAVELRALDGRPIKLDRPLPENIHTQNIHWSPDGKELAFFANGPGPVNPVLLYGVAGAEVMPERVASLENPAKLYIVNTERRTLTQVSTGDIELGPLGSPDFMWTKQGELVFRAPRRRYGFPGGPPPSRGAQWGWATGDAIPISARPLLEWLVLGRDGKSRDLVAGAKGVPDSLQPINGGEVFVGVSAGEVWHVDPAKGTLKNLTERIEPKVVGIRVYGSDKSVSHLLLTANQAGNVSYSLLDLASLQAMPLTKPALNARLADFDLESKTAVYISDDRDGETLWIARAGGKAEPLVTGMNSYKQNIVTSERRIINYTSLNGEKLKALLVFPPGYKPGRRCPLYVSVRLGTRVQDAEPSGIGEEDIWAAAGYVYLLPSIPQNVQGMGSNELGSEEGDSCLMPINGILPAVEKVIEMGIADPQRLFVSGQSRGGWTTLCLVGQTTRFTAAAAWISGSTGNIFSNTGGLGSTFTDRYSENPYDWVSPNGVNPKGYRPTDLPWWREGDRFRRNNPLSYVDRVQTPVMLITADFDALYQISEDYFKALVSMRKPARAVRYWGEAHGLQGSGNFRDYYMQMFAWYDQWGDIARDSNGNMIWDGDRVKGRNGAAPMKAADYSKMDLFQQPSNPKKDTTVDRVEK